MSNYLHNLSNSRSWPPIIVAFIFLIFLTNILQASFTGLHADEAYYWLYAEFLEWGYFDHPPMVAIFIKAGEFINGSLGLRLATCILQSVSIYLLWLIVKPYKTSISTFTILFSSVLLFHVYGFITTPDAPLFFFAVLFLYLYQQYLKKPTIVLSLLLGITASALLYSKYHGILLLFFILISNLSLFKQLRFYLIIIVAISLYLPHIFWQQQHNYPSLQYHLFDRSASPYQITFSLEYLINLLLVTGPLTGWYLYYQAYKIKINEDKFIKALVFSVYGILIFFFISTFKGRVQAHWPLLAFISVFILACISSVKQISIYQQKKLFRLFAINLLLILFSRVALAFPPKFLKKIDFVSSYSGYEKWAEQIKQHSNGYPVIFLDGFQNPSLYNFYTQTHDGFAYDSYFYRKTQYEIFPIEDSIRNKKVFFLSNKTDTSIHQEKVNTDKGIYWGSFIDSVRLYQKLNFIPQTQVNSWRRNEKKSILFKIENPYDESVYLKSYSQHSSLDVFYVIMLNGEIIKEETFSENFSKLVLEPKKSIFVRLKITSLPSKGNYQYFIVVKTSPFQGSRNSPMIKMNVN